MSCYLHTYPTYECEANRCPQLDACQEHQTKKSIQNKYSTEKWREFRRELIRKRGSKCEECNSKENLQVHHIERVTISPELFYVESNCQVLCRTCHETLHEEAQRKFEDHNWWDYDDEEELCSDCRINHHSSRFQTCYKCHTDPGWFMY